MWSDYFSSNKPIKYNLRFAIH